MTDRAIAAEGVNLFVLTPEDILLETQVHWVQVPLADGLIGIWPGHAPLVATMAAGALRYDAGAGPQEMEVPGGILRVDVERCVILIGSRAPAIEGPAQDREALAAELEEEMHGSLSEEEVEALQRREG